MNASAVVLDTLRRHGTPGLALAAKLTGGGAVEVVAQGATVRLSDGRELIDFGSYGVTLLGHRHPAIVAAVAEQLERMPTAARPPGR
jgi:putrescine aminotransferase